MLSPVLICIYVATFFTLAVVFAAVNVNVTVNVFAFCVDISLLAKTTTAVLLMLRCCCCF